MPSIRFFKSVDDIKFDNAGSAIAVAESSLNGNLWNGRLLYLTVPEGGFSESCDCRDFAVTLDTYSGNTELAWLGQTLVSGTDDGSLVLWDAAATAAASDSDAHAQDTSSTIDAHDDLVSSISTHKDALDGLLSASWDGQVKAWNVDRESSRTFAGHTKPINAVRFNPKDSTQFASVAQDRTLKVWDMRQTSAQQTIRSATVGHVFTIEWSATHPSQLIMGGEDGHVSVVDIKKPTAIVTSLAVHTGPVRRMAFSPHDVTTLAVTSDDCTASVVSIKDAQISTGTRLLGHSDFVRGVSWDPRQADVLATGSWDQSVIISKV
mmetsp:Transcript_25112/g.43340  ORF Transcript_25112/g.43340 Transcript_25112/m.43340 type:complete len:321 (-) Transcript_25112:189-1151(-)